MTAASLQPLNGPDMRTAAVLRGGRLSHDAGGSTPGAEPAHLDLSRARERPHQTPNRRPLGARPAPSSWRLAAGSNPTGPSEVWDIEAGRKSSPPAGTAVAVSAVRFAGRRGDAGVVGRRRDVRLTDAGSGHGWAAQAARLPVHGLAAARTAPAFGAVFFRGVRVWGGGLEDIFRLDGL